MDNQTNWFNTLKENAFSGPELASWISETLQLSIPTAYKKMNGQVRLTWDEYKKLESSSNPLFTESIKNIAFNESEFRELTPIQLIQHWSETLNSIGRPDQNCLMSCHELPIVYLFDEPIAVAYYMFQQYKLEEPTNMESFDSFKVQLSDKFYFAAHELKNLYLKTKRTEVIDPYAFRPFPRGLHQMVKQGFIQTEIQQHLLSVFTERVRSWSMQTDCDQRICARKLSPIPLLYNFLISADPNPKVVWEPFGIQGYKIKPGATLKPLAKVVKDIVNSSSEIGNCSLSRAFVDRKGSEYQRMLVNEDY